MKTIILHECLYYFHTNPKIKLFLRLLSMKIISSWSVPEKKKIRPVFWLVVFSLFVFSCKTSEKKALKEPVKEECDPRLKQQRVDLQICMKNAKNFLECYQTYQSATYGLMQQAIKTAPELKKAFEDSTKEWIQNKEAMQACTFSKGNVRNIEQHKKCLHFDYIFKCNFFEQHKKLLKNVNISEKGTL